MAKHEEQLSAVFSALSDPTRRRILERLSRGPLSVGEIAAGFSLTQPAISKHVRVLEDCGLLAREVTGRVHRCRLAPERMEAAASWIETQRSFWNATFDRLDTLFARKGKKST
jgi:DNA-binding transcriptional ArsR family regulator